MESDSIEKTKQTVREYNKKKKKEEGKVEKEGGENAQHAVRLPGVSMGEGRVFRNTRRPNILTSHTHTMWRERELHAH